MSVTVESLLINWGFEKYIDVFKENEVDICALELLDDEQVRVLIPTIGPQAKFKKASDWKAEHKVLEDLISKKDEELEDFISNYDSSNKLSTKSPSTSSRSESTISLCSLQTQSDLSLLLHNTPDGQLLLKHNVEKPLGEQYRKILVRTISKEIVRNDPKAHVTADIYSAWLQEIKRLFPSENLQCYYTKPKTGVHRAHGRLFDAVVNLKAKYRRHKVYQPRARHSLDKTLTPEPSTSTCNQSVEETTTQEEEECMEWLRCSCDDYALCAEKWEKTNKLRKQRVHSNEKASYLQEFPCLKRSFGYELLIADFDAWYPDNKYSLENKLPLLKSKLLSASECTSRRSPFVEELKQLGQDKDPETSNLAAVLLIPHMIGPVHMKRKRHSAADLHAHALYACSSPYSVASNQELTRGRNPHQSH